MNFKILILVAFVASTAAEVSKDVEEVKFFLYTSSNNEIEITGNKNANNLIAGAPTTIIIDGFLSNSSSPMSQSTKNSALSVQHNVIVVDWGRLSGSGLALNNLIATGIAYSNVLKNVGPVGQHVSNFIQSLRATKQITKFHIIGHSLGAHIAGAAGVFNNQYGSPKIARITGLDPAGPFFSLQVDANKRLHKGDAEFVDIYHSNRGTLGDSDHQTGDINVYINGGDNQPGCEILDKEGFAGFCSHSYSWKFYDLTAHKDIQACPCVGLPCQCNSGCNVQCDSISVGAGVPIQKAAGAYHVVISDVL